MNLCNPLEIPTLKNNHTIYKTSLSTVLSRLINKVKFTNPIKWLHRFETQTFICELKRV